MSIFTNVNDEEVIEKFKNQNLKDEDYNDVFDEPQFLRNPVNRSIWETEEQKSDFESINQADCIEEEDEDFKEEIDRYEIELPNGYEEIELYDNSKTYDENFEVGKNKKYILIEVNKKDISIRNPNNVLASPQSKCVIDIEKVEEFGSLEFIPIDYDTFWGLRFLTFINYNSDFFLCDERVMFEACLVKFKGFGCIPFHWSKEVIFNEVGIKKDRATKIIRKFITLGILSKKLVKTVLNNSPRQINFYNINVDRIIELIPKIYEKYDERDIDIESKIKEYLSPVLKK